MFLKASRQKAWLPETMTSGRETAPGEYEALISDTDARVANALEDDLTLDLDSLRSDSSRPRYVPRLACDDAGRELGGAD